MIKRIEFTLNLDDPREAAIYRALKPSLRYRRAGSIIRQALDSLLVGETVQNPLASHHSIQQENTHEQSEREEHKAVGEYAHDWIGHRLWGCKSGHR